jgi:hypothetical protein
MDVADSATPAGAVADAVADSATPKSQTHALRLQQQRCARLAIPSSPLTRTLVRRPRVACGASVALPLLALALIIGTGKYDFNSIDTRDYLIRNDLRTHQSDAVEAAILEFSPDPKTFVSRAKSADNKTAARSIPSSNQELQLVFRAREPGTGKLYRDVKDASIAPSVLTREVVSDMKRLEDAFLNTDRYDDYCLLDEDARDCSGNVPKCAPYVSITRHPSLYGKVNNSTGEVCGVEEGSALKSQAEFDAFLAALIDEKSGTVAQSYVALLGADTGSTRRSFVARSIFEFGLPHPTGVKANSFPSWSVSAVADNEALQRNDDALTGTWIGGDYTDELFTNQALRDLAYAGISVGST